MSNEAMFVRSIARVAIMIFVAGAACAEHEDAKEAKLGPCEPLGISDDVSCRDYCGEIGFDGVTTDADKGSPGSSFWVHEDFGEGCKCKTSPPGEEFDEENFKGICYDPPAQKGDEAATPPEGDSPTEEEDSDEEAFGKNAYDGSGDSPRCYCGDAEMKCDRIAIECNGGSSGSSIAAMMLSYTASMAMSVIMFSSLL